MYTAELSDALIARQAGFVYCLFAPRFAAAYVGQTLSSQGALGRLAQHLSFGSGNTFRQRICQHFGYENIDIGPVHFEAYELDENHQEFHNRARDHREAVEALAQFHLLNRFGGDSLSACVVISRVTLNPYAQVEYVKDMSNQVVEAFYARSCQLRDSDDWGH